MICQCQTVKMPKLTENEKVLILSKLEEGWSIRAVANNYGINKSTVLRVKKRWEQEGSVSRKEGSGRPKISNHVQDEALLNHLRENPFQTARDAVSVTNFPASWSTASRRITKSELKNSASAKKTVLTEEHKQSRILFCLNYVYRPQNFWDNVVFSDEKLFQSGHDGRIRVYRPAKSRYDERYVSSRNRSGRFSINVWAWVCVHCSGIAWRIGGRFNGQAYLDILENIMHPSVEQIYPNNSFIFQQDNSPIHTARMIRQWFDINNVEVLPWPACSPDLNPIENVWGWLVKHIYKRNFRPRNENELWAAIEESWEELSQNENYWRNLVSSMPARLNQVLEADGAMTKY